MARLRFFILFICLITNLKAYSQLDVQVLEYDYYNDRVMIRIANAVYVQKEKPLRVLARLSEEGSLQMTEKAAIVNVKRKITNISFFEFCLDSTEKQSRSHFKQKGIKETFTSIDRKVVVYVFDLDSTLLDSAVNYISFRQNRIDWKEETTKVKGQLILANANLSLHKLLRVSLLMRHDTLQSIVTWGTFDQSGDCVFNTEEFLKSGYRPYVVNTFLETDSTSEVIDFFSFDLPSIQTEVETGKTKLDSGLSIKSRPSVWFKKTHSLSQKIRKPAFRISGQFWMNGFYSTESFAGDSMPMSGIDAGSNLAFTIAGLPLKLHAIESTQDDFVGQMKQQTLSIDFNKLKEMLPGIPSVKSKEMIELEKQKLVAPGGLLPQINQNRVQIDEPKFLDSLKSQKNLLEDTLSSSVQTVKMKSDSIKDELQSTEDSIKNQLAELGSKKQKLLNKLQFIEDFSIGRITPYYGRYTMTSLPVDGVSLGIRHKTTAIAGFTGNSVPNVLNMHANTLNRWQMRGLKFEKEVTPSQKVVVSGLHASQPVNNQALSRLNSAAEVGYYFQSSNTGFFMNAQLGTATTSIQSSESRTYAWNREYEYAIFSELGYDFKKIQTQLGVNYEVISDDYFTAGNPFLRRAYREYGVFAKGVYFDGMLGLKAKWLLRDQRLHSSTNRNSNAEFDLRFKHKGWLLFGSYKPFSVVGSFINSGGTWQFSNLEMDLMVFRANYSWKLNKTSFQQSITYTQSQSSSNDTYGNQYQNLQFTFQLRNQKLLLTLGNAYISNNGSFYTENIDDLAFNTVLSSNVSVFGVFRYNLTPRWTLLSDFNHTSGERVDLVYEERLSAGLGVNHVLKLIQLGIKSNFISSSDQIKGIWVSRFNISLSF